MNHDQDETQAVAQPNVRITVALTPDMREALARAIEILMEAAARARAREAAQAAQEKPA